MTEPWLRSARDFIPRSSLEDEETVKGILSSASLVLVSGDRMLNASTSPLPSQTGPAPVEVVERRNVTLASIFPAATMSVGTFFFTRRANSTIGCRGRFSDQHGQIVATRTGHGGNASVQSDVALTDRGAASQPGKNVVS